ncbi:hypothetical protein EXIGUO8H_100005 [Exiguobacterium sp. 8H]|nr:hypothetical protein EXIGUO8H_100005 [Exiguobacterium sp. 8H]
MGSSFLLPILQGCLGALDLTARGLLCRLIKMMQNQDGVPFHGEQDSHGAGTHFPNLIFQMFDLGFPGPSASFFNEAEMMKDLFQEDALGLGSFSPLIQFRQMALERGSPV